MLNIQPSTLVIHVQVRQILYQSFSTVYEIPSVQGEMVQGNAMKNPSTPNPSSTTQTLPQTQ